MTKHLLDSNVLILALRSQTEALDSLEQLQAEEIPYISVATRTEVLAGMRPYEGERTLELLASFASLPVSTSIADRAGRLIYDHACRGIQVSFPDALIAATALEHDLILVTTNVKHFPMLEGRVRALFPTEQ